MQEFVGPLIGGVLIGLAASLLLLFKGKIFGISGILYGVIRKPDQDFSWRLFILIGLVLGGFLFNLVSPGYYNFETPGEIYLYAIAGLLVGFGTKLGSGCTSGHGVCGIGRLSVRSITATLTFMLFGIITVWAMGV
jgi:uncharacterized membrane protein YedE/YeeE